MNSYGIPVKRKAFRRAAPFLLLTALLAALAAALYHSNFHISVEEYRISGAPQGFAGFRIVQVSDLHARELGEKNEALLSAIAEQAPDIIVITGDLIDGDGQLDVIAPLLESLVKLAPVYYVTGNHEYSTQLRELRLIMAQVGVAALDNDYVRLSRGGDALILAGVEDPNGDINMKTPAELLEDIYSNEGQDAYVTLLAHRYDLAEYYAALGADLIISGHAHGGLVRLPFTDGLIGPGRDFFPEHTSGLYEIGESRLVTSRGLAPVSILPRLFNPLHLPVIIFE